MVKNKQDKFPIGYSFDNYEPDIGPFAKKLIDMTRKVLLGTNKMITIKCKKENENATTPTKSHQNDAGFDLYACESVSIYSGQRKLVDTGSCCAIPQGYCGVIKDRSGLANKSGITILGGVIDSDYRGPIKVIMYNTSSDIREVSIGDRIAQMLILPVAYAGMSEVDNLDDTVRGNMGFGSTGK